MKKKKAIVDISINPIVKVCKHKRTPTKILTNQLMTNPPRSRTTTSDLMVCI